jgi:hypothetical protein
LKFYPAYVEIANRVVIGPKEQSVIFKKESEISSLEKNVIVLIVIKDDNHRDKEYLDRISSYPIPNV